MTRDSAALMKRSGFKSYLNFKYTWENGCQFASRPWVDKVENQETVSAIAVVG